MSFLFTIREFLIILFSIPILSQSFISWLAMTLNLRKLFSFLSQTVEKCESFNKILRYISEKFNVWLINFSRKLSSRKKKFCEGLSQNLTFVINLTFPIKKKTFLSKIHSIKFFFATYFHFVNLINYKICISCSN